MMNLSKKFILYLDNLFCSLKIYFYSFYENLIKVKIYLNFFRFVKNNKIILFILKISFISLYVFVNYNEVLKFKVLFTIYLVFFICVSRILLKIILYNYEWDGKYPVKNLKRLNLFFKDYININKSLVYIFKYINIWRAILLLRNKIIKIFRYIRYIFFRFDLLYVFINFERKIRFIIERFFLEYIRLVIQDIYIPLKKKIFFSDILNLVEWRFIILLLLIWFKSVPFVLKYILIYKAIQVIWDVLLYDFSKKERSFIAFSYNDNNIHCLSMFLYKESYLLKNLNIEKISNYDEWFYPRSRDNFYLNLNWGQHDFYKGFYIKDVELINNYLMFFSEYFMLFEYALTREELKTKWNFCCENLKDFYPIINLLKDVIILIKQSSKLQKLIYTMDVNRADFSIGLRLRTLTDKELINIKSCITKEYRTLIDSKFKELRNYSEYIEDKYEMKDTKEYNLICEIFDSRSDRYDLGDYSLDEDEKLYLKVFKKYNL